MFLLSRNTHYKHTKIARDRVATKEGKNLNEGLRVYTLQLNHAAVMIGLRNGEDTIMNRSI